MSENSSMFQYCCEWNPLKHKEAKTKDIHAKAEFIVEKYDEIKLCDECAKLNRFKTSKKRPITEED